MPSFNLEKLRRLVEERSLAQLALADISNRLREERREMVRLSDMLMRNAGSHAAQEALQARMGMSASDLALMSADEIRTYEVDRRNEIIALALNVSTQELNKFIHARDSVQRLQGVEQQRREHLSSFAVVDSLLAAVSAWGFNLRDLGVA